MGEGRFVLREKMTIVERAIHAGCSREIALGKRPSPIPPSQKGTVSFSSLRHVRGRDAGGGGGKALWPEI